jgi:hypothetical protein
MQTQQMKSVYFYRKCTRLQKKHKKTYNKTICKLPLFREWYECNSSCCPKQHHQQVPKVPLPKANCAKQFSEGGCILCLKFFNSSQEINNHLYQHAKCGKPLVDATGTNKTSPIYVTCSSWSIDVPCLPLQMEGDH